MAELDPMDRQIFELLAENGRMSNLEVAGHIGVSEKTVRQRIRRLIERDGMRVRASLEQAVAPSRLIILMRAETGQRFSVAERLAALPEVDAVHLTNGGYELIAVASFATDSEALEFYVRHIERGAGIQESQYTHIVETVVPRTGLPSDHFHVFDEQAASVDSIAELLDLGCDVVTSALSADRVCIGTGLMWANDEDLPLWSNANMRWRGLSSRYVEVICTRRRADSVVIPNVVERHQHLFVADAHTDPLFESMRDLVVSEGFHSFMALPARHGDTRTGTMTVYWDSVIEFRADLAAQAQELADILGKNMSRFLNQPVAT
ncbi:MAG TPA: AsnC family transcriptional regulator [Acidimicrobiales bacterium]|nr:AsnC family transcriptional regulator [Acidimicrobiales bacterium]